MRCEILYFFIARKRWLPEYFKKYFKQIFCVVIVVASFIFQIGNPSLRKESVHVTSLRFSIRLWFKESGGLGLIASHSWQGAGDLGLLAHLGLNHKSAVGLNCTIHRKQETITTNMFNVICYLYTTLTNTFCSQKCLNLVPVFSEWFKIMYQMWTPYKRLNV